MHPHPVKLAPSSFSPMVPGLSSPVHGPVEWKLEMAPPL
jgi:hypothetical protein